MKGIGITLIVVGILGMVMGGAMFGDIGVAAMLGALVGILSGIGFIKAAKLQSRMLKLESEA
jgi:hypothetical protein